MQEHRSAHHVFINMQLSTEAEGADDGGACKAMQISNFLILSKYSRKFSCNVHPSPVSREVQAGNSCLLALDSNDDPSTCMA